MQELLKTIKYKLAFRREQMSTVGDIGGSWLRRDYQDYSKMQIFCSQVKPLLYLEGRKKIQNPFPSSNLFRSSDLRVIMIMGPARFQLRHAAVAN